MKEPKNCAAVLKHLLYYDTDVQPLEELLAPGFGDGLAAILAKEIRAAVGLVEPVCPECGKTDTLILEPPSWNNACDGVDNQVIIQGRCIDCRIDFDIPADLIYHPGANIERDKDYPWSA